MKRGIYLRKIISFLGIVVFIIITMTGKVNGAEVKTRLDIVQKSIEIKYLEDNQGTVSKDIISSNKDTGEATIQLSINNMLTNKTETEKYENTEILIIIPENIATDTEKSNQYIDYINTLATKVFEKNKNIKIGIVGMKGTICDRTEDENGNIVWGSNDERDVLGTEDNAEIVIKATSDVTAIKSAIQNMNDTKTKYYNNLQVAIKLSKNSYSKNVNKILISLFDNVPDIAIGVKKSVEYGGWNSIYATPEEAAIGQHENIVKKTKSEIMSLKDDNIDFILLRPENTSFDQKWYDIDTGNLELEFDGSPYVQELYGTLENPIYGKMYSLNDASLEKVVTEYIYSDVMEKVGKDMHKLIVTDYFPKEVIDNFTITIAEANKDNVDTSKLQTDKYITWNVGDLKNNETATLKYTIKMENMKNAELLNKTIATNEKVEGTYINYDNKKVMFTLSSSPKIKLTEIKEEIPQINTNQTNNDTNQVVDNTIAQGTIPQTGIDITIIISMIALIIIAIIIHIKTRNYRDIK